jgi:hypothetical protein
MFPAPPQFRRSQHPNGTRRAQPSLNLSSVLLFPTATPPTSTHGRTLSLTSGMDGEALPFGYTHRQQKVSAAGGCTQRVSGE